MSVSIPDFWRLAVESRLATPADCGRWDAAFAGFKGAAAQANAAALGEWLVAGQHLSRYQVKTLLSGRPGRFFYGDYCVYDRLRARESRLGGLLRALHLPTRHPVLLYLDLRGGSGTFGPEARDGALTQVAWACWIGSPFVAQFYQWLELEDCNVVVLENLVGETVADRLARAGRLPPADACRFACQAALGLARIHQLGQVHGLVRPENLWIQADGSLKVLPGPLAPDLLKGPGPIEWTADDLAELPTPAPQIPVVQSAGPGLPPDAASDIHALGITIHQMLTGELPSPNANGAGQIAISSALGVPPPLAHVVGRLLSNDPHARYQDALQAAEALTHFFDAATLAALPSPAPTAAAYEQWLERQPRLPGIKPGAIPTASQIAAYNAAQFPAQIAAPPAAPPAPAFAPPTIPPPAMPALQPPPIPEPPVPAFAFAGSSEPPGFSEPPSFSEPRGSSPWFGAEADPAARWDAPAGVAVDSPAPSSERSTTVRSATKSKLAKPKKNSLLPFAIAGGLAALLLIGALVAIHIHQSNSANGDGEIAAADSADGSHPSGTPSGSTAKSANGGDTSHLHETSLHIGDPANPPGTGPAAPPASSETFEQIADDGTSLWISPTAGPPLSLDYVGPGAQLLFAVRPARILGRTDGGELLPALGPWGEAAQKTLAQWTGLELKQIDQVLLVLHSTDAGPPATTVIVRTGKKIDSAARLAGWGNPAAAKEGDATYYLGQPLSYYLPEKEGGRLLVVGPESQIRESIQSAGAPPLLSRHLEAILPHADADRDMTLAFIPQYVFGDGQSAFAGPLAPLRQPLENFFGDDPKAVLLSCHFQVNFFLEMRLLGPASREPESLSGQYAGRVRQIPNILEDDLEAIELHPYGKKLLRRFPEWMRLLADYTRGGVEDDEPVLRCYLPEVAEQNLLMAVDLALAEQPGAGAAVAKAGGPDAGTPQTVAQRLKKKTTLTFPRDTLERALQLLFDDVGVKYQILGGDMQLEGITKNQSFGLDEHDKPADEILRKIMLLANPDGKLVYVVKSPPGGTEMVFITTRAAVAKRGDKLPPELEQGGKPPRTKAKAKP